MNSKYLVIPFILLALIGCKNRNEVTNQFKSYDDTLKIQMEKYKGEGIFSMGVSPLYMKDTTNTFFSSVIYPEGIEKIKRTEYCIDFAAHRFYRYKEGEKRHKEYLIKDIESNRIDTSICPPKDKNYINIIEGYKNGERIFIVDGNNNKDFTDDSIRFVEKIEWENSKEFKLVECQFPIYNGTEIVLEKSWLKIGTSKNRKELWGGKFEHLVANFAIDKNQFQIAIKNDGVADFTYDLYISPALLFVSLKTGENNKLEEADFLQLGEIFHLGNNYYRIENISHSGEVLTLVREKDYKNIVGTQVGMKAPEFECVSIEGDTISSADFRDKSILIVNMCECGGDKQSVEAYKEIVSKYDDEYYIFGLDSKFEEKLGGLLINTQKPYNKDFYKNYRKMYCSRMSYIIDQNGRIINKFSSYNWKGKME